MHVRIVTARGPIDVTVGGLTPEHTVGDVLAAAGLTAPPVVWVDGREVSSSSPATYLYRGGGVSLEPQPPWTGEESIWELHALTGPKAGHVWRLARGRYRVGPGGPVDLGAPGHAPVALDIDAGGARWSGTTVGPSQNLTTAGMSVRLCEPTGRLPGRAGGFTFNRPPRVISSPRPATLVPPAPEVVRGAARQLSVIALILPAVFGVVMAVVFGRLMFLAFALMGPVMMVGHTLDDRRRRRRAQRRADRQYTHDLAQFSADLQAAAETEAHRRRLAAPYPARLLSAVDAGAPDLWERRPAHHDYMTIPLGDGTVAWDPVPGDEHPPEVAELLGIHGCLRRAPVEITMRAGITVGVNGGAGEVAATLRAWLASALAGHGPADLRLAILTDNPARWEWTKWVPHVALAAGKRMLADDADQARTILGFLRTPAVDAAPLTLLVDDRPGEPDDQRGMLRDVLAGAGKPVTAFVIRPRPEDLPGAATHRLDFDTPQATLTTVRGRGQPVGFVPRTMAASAADHFARRLGRLSDPEVNDDGPPLPDHVPLTGLLGWRSISPSMVRDLWRHDPRGALSAPIGVDGSGPLMVDLVADGPHALVAGTTGAGKSELLRSWIGALAARYDTCRLNFVLVDYKGGAAFDACARLPHVVGLVTDLDDDLAARALTCLEAELRLRESWLRDSGASELGDYVAPNIERTLPRLVIVIDEFAALATELPDFMQALVDIAQRGRSLGVHLILATQRPAGIVKDAIRANTNIRICLRVQGVADARDVIDSPAAARIARSMPGRGYLRLGPGELMGFQAGFAGSPSQGQNRPPLRITPFRFSMDDDLPPAAPSSDGMTVLDELATAIQDAHVAEALSPPRRPWPDPLPVSLPLEILETHAEVAGEAIRVPLGLEDRPDRQEVVPWYWQPDRDGGLVLAGLSGPAATMRTIAAGCARFHPEQVHLYAIDMGDGSLAALAELPHTGAVTDVQDPERVRRLLRWLSDEIDLRRHERSTTPTILFIDGLAQLRALFDEAHDRAVHEQLDRIVASGPDARIYPVIGVAQARSIPGRMLGSIATRLLFQMAERTDYSALGATGRRVPELPEGRAIQVPRQRLIQVASTAHDTLDDRVAAWDGAVRSAPPVLTLPRVVKLTEVLHAAAGDGPLQLPTGVRDDSLEPATIALESGEHLLITGPPGSGKSTLLAALATAASDVVPGWRLLALTPRPSPVQSTTAIERVVATVDELASLLAAPAEPTVVVIDDAADVADSAQMLDKLLAARAAGCHILAAGRADDLRRLPRHWTKRLRAARTGIVLQPVDAADGDPVGIRLGRRLADPMPPGRGYLRAGSEIVLFQAALP